MTDPARRELPEPEPGGLVDPRTIRPGPEALDPVIEPAPPGDSPEVPEPDREADRPDNNPALVDPRDDPGPTDT